MSEDNESVSASVMITAIDGQMYDLNNISGHRLKQLVEDGMISMSTLNSNIGGGNITGVNRKALMESRENNGITVKPPVIDITTLEEGNLVSYKNTVTEVKKINIEKGLVFIDIKGKKKGWISIEKFKPVNIPPIEEE